MVTHEEFRKFYQSRGLPVPPDLEELVRTADVNHDGILSVVEFVSASMDPSTYQEPALCRAAFGIIDADKDGLITRADVECFLEDRNPRREEIAARIMREVNAGC